VGGCVGSEAELPTTTLLQILTFLFTSSGGGLGGEGGSRAPTPNTNTQQHPSNHPLLVINMNGSVLGRRTLNRSNYKYKDG